MKTPKSVTKAMKHPDKLGAGANKRKRLGKKNTITAVMKEWKRGTLRSGGSGKHVGSRKQAVAIALSESKRKKR